MHQIKESKDYERLTYFWAENGLEIEAGVPRSEHVLNCWEYLDGEGRLIGAAALEKRAGEFVVADLAVDSACRGTGLGTAFMEIIEAEIISLGGKSAWLVGMAPDFYLKLGWKAVAREQAPNISKCFTCPKFGGECRPEIMCKSF